MPDVVLRIDGMRCTGCESRLEDRLARLDGVRSAEADHGAGQATVRFVAGREDAQAVHRTVSDLGYTVVEVEQG